MESCSLLKQPCKLYRLLISLLIHFKKITLKNHYLVGLDHENKNYYASYNFEYSSLLQNTGRLIVHIFKNGMGPKRYCMSYYDNIDMFVDPTGRLNSFEQDYINDAVHSSMPSNGPPENGMPDCYQYEQLGSDDSYFVLNRIDADVSRWHCTCCTLLPARVSFFLRTMHSKQTILYRNM